MNITEIKKQIIRHEGVRSKPYRCSAGKLTIGVGRNLDDIGLSGVEIDFMLDNDLDRCIQQAEGFMWFSSAPDAVQGAVVNLIFNLGLAGFSQFRRTIAHLIAQEYELAGAELLNSRYAEQVPARAQELANQIADSDSRIRA